MRSRLSLSLSLSLTGWYQVGFYPAPIPSEAS
jgi:hypothetical protein